MSSKAVEFSFINPSDIMLKSTYDVNTNGIVDVAQSVIGIDSATNNSFYGKVNNVDGFYEIPTEYSMNDLTDIVIDNISSGDLLVYNGINFENRKLSYIDIVGTPSLSSVATSGSYNDLTQQPSIPERLSDLVDVNLGGIAAGQTIQWNGTTFIPVNMGTGGSGGSLNELSDVTITNLQSGQLLKFNGAAFVNETISYSELTDTPTLSTVATSGDYNDLNNKPDIFSGSYNDLSDKPSIPSSLTHLSDVGYITANTGQVLRYNGSIFTNANISYNDLIDTPTPISVPTSIDDMDDVDISGITTGQVLQWDGNGFIAASMSSGGGASTLGDLSDVEVSTATNGQVLQYNGTTWIPASVTGASGNTTVERIRINYTGASMAYGTVGTSECYEGYSSNVTPVLVSNNSVADFITEITFTGYNYPPSHIMYYGFDAANNRYEIRPLFGQAAIQYVPNNTSDLVNPSPFGSFDKIRLTTAASDTSAAPKTGLPTTPGHAWIVLIMQG